VYGTPDVEATTARLRKEHGLNLVVGGRHPGRGTRNTLANLGDGAYLEVVGPDPDQPRPELSPFGVHDLDSERLITWAVRTDHMADALAHARAAGYDPGAAASMQRATPGGEMLTWELTQPPLGDDGGLVPFIIDWGDTAHPTTTLPEGATLTELIGSHQNAAKLKNTLSALRVELSVHQGKAPSLTAVINGPNGRFRLR
jgi:Glyoxalase-like domain